MTSWFPLLCSILENGAWSTRDPMKTSSLLIKWDRELIWKWQEQRYGFYMDKKACHSHQCWEGSKASSGQATRNDRWAPRKLLWVSFLVIARPLPLLFSSLWSVVKDFYVPVITTYRKKKNLYLEEVKRETQCVTPKRVPFKIFGVVHSQPRSLQKTLIPLEKIDP